MGQSPVQSRAHVYKKQAHFPKYFIDVGLIVPLRCIGLLMAFCVRNVASICAPHLGLVTFDH